MSMTKNPKPATKPPNLSARKRRRPPLDEFQKIVELAESLQPKRRRYKVKTVPVGMDD